MSQMAAATRPGRRGDLGARDPLDHQKRVVGRGVASRGKLPQATRRTGRPNTTVPRPGVEASPTRLRWRPDASRGTPARRPTASLSGCHPEGSSPWRARKGDWVQEGCKKEKAQLDQTTDGRANWLSALPV